MSDVTRDVILPKPLTDAKLLSAAQNLVKNLATLDELQERRRQLAVAEEKRRLEWGVLSHELEERIKDAQRAYDLEHRMLCCAEGESKVFQVGDKAVVVTWPIGANLANIQIAPLVVE